MDLGGSWEYIQSTARNRLDHNKTPRHIYEYGESIEIIGVAGEVAARRFLGLSEHVHERFDHGVDIRWNEMTIDVKATILTPSLQHKFLQWPRWKWIKAEVILLTAIDPLTRTAVVVGFAYKHEILKAAINETRSDRCHEIAVCQLHHPWELMARFVSDAGKGSSTHHFIKRSENGMAPVSTA